MCTRGFRVERKGLGGVTIKTGVHAAWSRVARIAGHVISQHQDNVGVWHAHPFDGPIDSQRVGDVPVVEPEARCADQNRPVVRVRAGDTDGMGLRE
jgi:hypothetical protein